MKGNEIAGPRGILRGSVSEVNVLGDVTIILLIVKMIIRYPCSGQGVLGAGVRCLVGCVDRCVRLG